MAAAPDLDSDAGSEASVGSQEDADAEDPDVVEQRNLRALFGLWSEEDFKEAAAAKARPPSGAQIPSSDRGLGASDANINEHLFRFERTVYGRRFRYAPKCQRFPAHAPKRARAEVVENDWAPNLEVAAAHARHVRMTRPRVDWDLFATGLRRRLLGVRIIALERDRAVAVVEPAANRWITASVRTEIAVKPAWATKDQELVTHAVLEQYPVGAASGIIELGAAPLRTLRVRVANPSIPSQETVGVAFFEVALCGHPDMAFGECIPATAAAAVVPPGDADEAEERKGSVPDGSEDGAAVPPPRRVAQPTNPRSWRNRLPLSDADDLRGAEHRGPRIVGPGDAYVRGFPDVDPLICVGLSCAFSRGAPFAASRNTNIVRLIFPAQPHKVTLSLDPVDGAVSATRRAMLVFFALEALSYDGGNDGVCERTNVRLYADLSVCGRASVRGRTLDVPGIPSFDFTLGPLPGEPPNENTVALTIICADPPLPPEPEPVRV